MKQAAIAHLFSVQMECKWLFMLALCWLATSASEDGKQLGYKRYRRGESQRATWRLTADANRLFAHRLYANVARSRRLGNLMISPYVVSSAMSMTLLGARGQTEQEIMTTLGYSMIESKRNGEPYTKTDVHKLYQSFTEKTKKGASQSGCQFTVANKLYGDQSESFLPEFINVTGRYYDAKFEEVNFMRDPDGVREVINAWVRNKTNGAIDEGVPPGAISSATMLTLVSTAYFKGEWKNKFLPELTTTGLFHKRDGTTVETDFMHGKFSAKYRHSPKLKSEILILPYKSPKDAPYDVEMQLFLPRYSKMLHTIEQLREVSFHQALRKMSQNEIEIHLPKFVMEFEIDLVENLRALGIRSLFGSADLSGMNGKRNLNLGNAIHKSFIEVNEEGTTAAASIAMSHNRAASPPIVRFDRPFVFIIVEKTTNSILFMGRLDQPN